MSIDTKPTAAVIANSLDRKKWREDETNVLVFDLGSGHIDASLVNDEGMLKVKDTLGDTHLGAFNFDNNLVNCLVELLKRMYKKDLNIGENYKTFGGLR